jgi:glycosyltransferase involved in cell wall biosynthesis
MGHDPALGGLYRAVTAFSVGLAAPILSVEPIARVYGACEGNVFRLEAVGGSFKTSPPYLGSAVDVASEPLLHNTGLLVVHSLFRGHVGFAMRWAAQQKKHYWAVPHGCLDPWGMARHAIRKSLWMTCIGGRFLEKARRVIFATERERSKALKRLSLRQTAVIHFPVQIPDVDDREAARTEFRSWLGIPEHSRVLMSVGRLSSMKRPQALIAAFARAQAKNLTLVMVGGDDDLTVRQLRSWLPPDTGDRIVFTGPLYGNALHKAWLSADGFISLSHRENFGFSLAEACAYGVPFIATPGHDLVHEMPVQGSSSVMGWILPDFSEAAAVQAIGEFARADDSRLHACGTEARRWASENLSPSRFRASLQALRE